MGGNNLKYMKYKTILQITESPIANLERLSGNIKCGSYNFTNYYMYINNQMNNTEAEKFEHHCETCSQCLRGIYLSSHKKKLEIDINENKYLFHKSIAVLDKLDRQKNYQNIIDIFLKISDNVLSVIKTSGEILSNNVPAAVRGTTIKTDNINSLEIIKDFSDPPLSVQITILPQESGDELILRLSLFQTVLNEFMDNTQITVDDRIIEAEYFTDENGQAEITLNKSRTYTIACKSDNQTIAEINIFRD